MAGSSEIKMSKPIFIVLGLLVVACIVFAVLFFTKDTTVKEVTYTGETLESGIKNISNMCTAEYYYKHMEKLQKEETKTKIFGISIPGTDSVYIYSCKGVVTAYVDFGQVQIEETKGSAEDGTQTVTEIKIKLPEIQLKSTVDHDSFEECYDDSSTFNPFTPDETNGSFQAIESQELENAKANGIVEKAESNAKTILENFIKGFAEYSAAKVEIIPYSAQAQQ